MVIFMVCCKDQTEKALARLFLQQFEHSQKGVVQSPHCEFRRPNDPPAEVEYFGSDEGDTTRKDNIGYLSFTFFPFHVKTPEARSRAIDRMINFFPYLDKHIKSTKSYMHSRMRSKKDDLLRELNETSYQTRIGTNKRPQICNLPEV